MLNNDVMKKIEQLEEERFLLAMKDRWNNEDRKRDDELLATIKKLKNI